MALTQIDIVNQMLAQLRVLDPSVSAAVGTPERKIIDTVAQALADAQVDLTALSTALDLDAKYGSNLDKFLTLFGFARQTATFAIGFATFSRTTASTSDIRIPSGTQIATDISLGTGDLSRIIFYTTATVILTSPNTSIIAPIRASVAGASGNLAANTLKVFVGNPVLGITAVTNPVATGGGADAETDDAFKVRFKNTVFRNVSGTEDQYLALALSTAFTKKANVIGAISRYREYIQVPKVNDTATDSGFAGNPDGGHGASQWTSALSGIPYSKYSYATTPAFISESFGTLDRFYQEGIDYVVNYVGGKNYGDSYRQLQLGVGIDPLSAAAQTRPNVTFTNIYSGTDPAVQALTPASTVLFEHSYVSSQSRNDVARNVTNCVDVFIDGGNNLPANVVLPLPITANVFNTTTTDKLYYDNYRRIGDPQHRPLVNNLFQALYRQPSVSLPSTIVVNGQAYLQGVHFWAIEDITSDLRGTVRCRNGIEWSATVKGQNLIASDPVNPGNTGYTGVTIQNSGGSSVQINGYNYDANVLDIQAACEGSKQVTTDVLIHKAKMRYFKSDVYIMYTPGSTRSDVNNNIKTALTIFLGGQYFGSVIQLSDILQVIHNVAGVDNVRFTRDVLTSTPCLTETDINGNPITTVIVDRTTPGGGVNEIHSLYTVGNPTAGTFTLTWVDNVGVTHTTGAIAYNAASGAITTALGAASGGGIPATCTGGTGVQGAPWTISFTGTQWNNNVITVTPSFTAGDAFQNKDFFLRDNELPAIPTGLVTGDTVAGLILRPKAQNTWGS